MGKLNLQARLTIILGIFCVLAVAGTIFRAWVVADAKISGEVESISDLVNRMFSIAELGVDSPFNPETEPAFLSQLIALENIRHIDIRIQSEAADYPQVNIESRDTIRAPDWFIGMVYPDSEMEIRTFRQGNGDIISIYADPGNEIEELWEDTRNRILASLAFLLMLIAASVWFTRRWMQPVEIISGVLDNVEQGDFSRRIPAFTLPEFTRLGNRINHLTTWLGYSKSENERLTRKSILVQEQERRHLAQELHDSLGQAVSAIKAIAVSIASRLRDSDPQSAESAENIEDIADKAYKSVRSLMTTLRPSVLDELGLTAALSQMVDDWNIAHEDTFCRLRIDGQFSGLHEDQRINVYRIVQEALTNISKYAKAENVTVTLSGSEIITLLIADDGVGFAINEITQSMGLQGIRDRVTLLQGALEINSKPGRGVTVQIEFPRMNHYKRRAADRREVLR